MLEPNGVVVILSKRRRIALVAVAAVVLCATAAVAILAVRFEPVVRAFAISALRERYKSDVELGDLRISLFPFVHATGENLVLWYAGRHDLPPLVRVRRFTLDTGFRGFFQNPKRFGKVRLEGLEIHIPPASARPGGRFAEPSGRSSTRKAAAFVLDEVIADGAMLETAPGKPGKDPMTFDLRELTLRTVGIDQPMTFHAVVENPKPPGLIRSDGRFGPWNAAQPGETPVSGEYTFRNADLGVFKGISGTLASDGRYQGCLDRIEVQGTADVPNFALAISGHPMPLHTSFEATVDGRNGDTVLHPVKARIGSSDFEVTGSVERNALERRKTIALNAKTGASARLEDVLRLAVKAANPPMTGRIAFTTNVKVPPGQNEVVDRIQLDGNFTLSGVKFADTGVERKLATLSRYAQGNPSGENVAVTAEFRGAFHLLNDWLALPDLQFSVPGARVSLAGGYGLRSGAMDFQGTARMDAKVSQMTTGIKSLLLRPLDLLLARDGAGIVVPLHIGGTRGQPSFHIDFGQMLRRK